MFRNTKIEKLIIINWKVTSTKKRHEKVEKKLNYHTTSYTKSINDLKKEVTLISTKELTNDLM